MVGTINSIILESLLETLPMEFSIIDKNDKVLAWNKHETRLFKRPVGVVGKDVRNCHPKHSLDKVEQLLDEMKKGTREKAEFWIDMKLDNDKTEKVLIQYFALRDNGGQYIGCLECSQKVGFIQNLKGEKRLLD
ncbi:MAG: PAS domain-containing protein, partial [Bacteroidales bacterium]|nr:PAS domain-containing protein [Bacteroidales bacterium]